MASGICLFITWLFILAGAVEAVWGLPGVSVEGGANLSLFPAGKAICGTGLLSTGETGAGCKDGNGERAEGAIHGHQANEGGNKEITLIFLFWLSCINT